MQKVGRDGNALDLRVGRGHEKSGKSEQVIRNMREHPIEILLVRKLIKKYQHAAAEMLLSDWQIAGGDMRAQSLEPSVDAGTPASTKADDQCDALARIGNALKQMGNVDRAICMLVVIQRMNLESLTVHMIRQGHTWNDRVAAPRLREALHALAEAYGLVTRRTISTVPDVE